jgi:hypothetical protein
VIVAVLVAVPNCAQGLFSHPCQAPRQSSRLVLDNWIPQLGRLSGDSGYRSPIESGSSSPPPHIQEPHISTPPIAIHRISGLIFPLHPRPPACVLVPTTSPAHRFQSLPTTSSTSQHTFSPPFNTPFNALFCFALLSASPLSINSHPRRPYHAIGLWLPRRRRATIHHKSPLHDFFVSHPAELSSDSVRYIVNTTTCRHLHYH